MLLCNSLVAATSETATSETSATLWATTLWATTLETAAALWAAALWALLVNWGLADDSSLWCGLLNNLLLNRSGISWKSDVARVGHGHGRCLNLRAGFDLHG